ncbi:DUF2730 family protein [Roseibium sp. SCP14]|uniref:DUF2730 family protein n=1 Tax=Roseibium sp. SCP14 TaxID=3141375 RepID=UPI00333AD40F
MLPEDLNEWASLVALVFSIGAVLKAWLGAKSEGHTEELRAHEQKLIELDRRVQAAESELNHMPAKDDVVELKISMAELRGTVSQVGESLSSVSRTVRRVEDYLMKKEGS